MITAKQLFIKFLKDNDAYEQYVFNFNNREKYRNEECPKNQFFSKTERKEYILCAFTWEDTLQGHIYWAALSYNWEKALKTSGLNY